jgi:mono/diheme cytochrome c family protein/heme/copper-type cytochrome/quinol oxidase subunit 4
MAKKAVNEHAQDHEAHHEHSGSSVGFYIFIALVLGVITYIEFALVEHQTTWFAMLSGGWILFWLILLSVVKFILVVMFFMHLKGDYAAFTGFFVSGMVIAVGTLFGLWALFTVRSVALAETAPQAGTEVHGAAHGEEEAHGEEAHIETDPEQPLAHRLEYPTPKDQGAVDYSPLGQEEGGGDTSGETTSEGLPRAPEAGAVALVDPFSAEGAQVAQTAAGDAQETGGGDPAAGEALYAGALGCAGCHAPDGTGGVGPNLTDSEWIYGGDEASISETLHNGRPGGMPAFSGQASEEDIANVVAYVMSLGGAQGQSGNAGGGN